jgi:hypothetical protein
MRQGSPAAPGRRTFRLDGADTRRGIRCRSYARDERFDGVRHRVCGALRYRRLARRLDSLDASSSGLEAEARLRERTSVSSPTRDSKPERALDGWLSAASAARGCSSTGWSRPSRATAPMPSRLFSSAGAEPRRRDPAVARCLRGYRRSPPGTGSRCAAAMGVRPARRVVGSEPHGVEPDLITCAKASPQPRDDCRADRRRAHQGLPPRAAARARPQTRRRLRGTT